MGTVRVRTEICIPVDTEFSIGGAFINPTANKPVGERRVYCDIAGEEQGLGFLLSHFAEYDINATFFVEALNSCYFGDNPMRRVAERILAAGQDVQLHLHPCWTLFRKAHWAEEIKYVPPNDSCAGRTMEEITEFISLGLQAFERWGVPRPIVLRTGGFQTDRTVYAAMARLQIPLASNLGLSYQPPLDPTLHLTGGRHWVNGVMELPVLTYANLRVGSWRRDRLFSIASTSYPQVEALLWAGRRNRVSPIVILIHPFDFVKTRDVQYNQIMRDQVNQNRLIHLCRFVKQHADEFVSVNFRESQDRWLQADDTNNPNLTVPMFSVFRCIGENKLNNIFWRKRSGSRSRRLAK